MTLIEIKSYSQTYFFFVFCLDVDQRTP